MYLFIHHATESKPDVIGWKTFFEGLFCIAISVWAIWFANKNPESKYTATYPMLWMKIFGIIGILAGIYIMYIFFEWLL